VRLSVALAPTFERGQHIFRDGFARQPPSKAVLSGGAERNRAAAPAPHPTARSPAQAPGRDELCVLYDFMTNTPVGAVASAEWLTFDEDKIVSVLPAVRQGSLARRDRPPEADAGGAH
jgi:hypothetical protein